MSGDDLYMDAGLINPDWPQNSPARMHVMRTTKPQVVCLCGSTKFKDEFIKQNFELTLRGNIVLTVGWFNHADGMTYNLTDFEKEYLDELHKRKIDLADSVLILNVGGYVGDSTRSEVDYALSVGKPVQYLEY